MLFLQGTYLLFLTYEFLAIRGGYSQYLTGNCTFDENTLCSWHNDKHTDHFDWLLRQGSTPTPATGPINDHSGSGSYIYIETSHPRKYNEKARLNSPWMRGAQRMTFFYSMYGSTIETLSVYVRINGSEVRIWSRYGNHLSSNWIKGCVTLNYSGTYQVIIEGVAGVTFTSNIAVDDFNFSQNLSCVSVGKPTPPETFEVDCTFDKNYCGWRNLLTPPNDQINWYRRRSGNQSDGTGPSGDHTGGGFYIYIEASQLSQVDQSAQLLSPLIRGPKCFRFYYHMHGRHIGRLDVSLQLRGQPSPHLMWRRSGEQGDQWMKANVDIGYTGESQVVLQATIGRNSTGGIAVDDVTLTEGLCHDDSEPSSILQGNCNFDVNFCFWRNNVNAINSIFDWTRNRYSTPSSGTGPRADHTSVVSDCPVGGKTDKPGKCCAFPFQYRKVSYDSCTKVNHDKLWCSLTANYDTDRQWANCVNGMYIYLETSSPRKPGDTARLESPWMRGPQCMMFYYHMFGSSMSCVVIYIRSEATKRSKPVWLRSQDRGDRWLQGQLSINETTSYKIIIDGVRGSSFRGDAALDDFTFQTGTCQQTEETTYYVSSYKGKDFRISTQPSEHSGFSDEFRFTLEHPRGNPRETPYFLYSGASSGQSFVTSTLGRSNFPLDVVVLNSEALGRNSRKIYLIDRSNYSPMISLYDHENVTCCKLNFSFYAFNVTETGNRSISGCAPGWYKAGQSCYMFYFESSRTWLYARNFCHKLGADLAVVNNAVTLDALANQRREIKLDGRDLYLGLSSKLRWIWLNGENASMKYNMWGPNEPSGDGRCGSLLNGIGWDSRWAGYGWRWNDASCTSQMAGYICEQPQAVPMPVALFSLSGTNGTLDISPNGATKAVSNNITFAPGPFGNPNGSFFFSGISSSYVELKNTGELDTRFSISVFAWVHLDNNSGPIFKYGCSMWVLHLILGVEVRYVDRKSSKIHVLHKTNVLEANAWNFIGTTYDYHTGFATVWVNDNIVMQKSIGAKMELATQSNVTVGASRKQETHFRGRLSCLQFYDQALSVDQKVKARCNKTNPFMDINIRSEGCDDPGIAPGTCGIASIMVNGIDRSLHRRGYDVVIVDARTGKVLDAVAFDTYGDGLAGDRLRDYLNAVHGDKIVLVAVQDEGSRFMDSAIDALKRLGAIDPIKTEFRGSFALAGYAHVNKPSWIAQRWRSRGQGPSEISLKIQFDHVRFYATPLSCSPNFFPFHGGCFSVNTKNIVNWHQALAQCNREGGTLAKISREGLRYAFSNMLEEMRPKPNNLYIGMLAQDDWAWIDGSPLNGSLWMPGYPTPVQKTQSCAMLSAGSSRIKNVDCGLNVYPLCQKQSVNSLSHRSLTQSSSVLLPNHPLLAIDRSYTTCFRSQKESNPWWQVTLEKPLYVESVEITDKIDCCPRDNGIINVTVSTSQTGLDSTCRESMAYGGKVQDNKFHCSPPARGSYVTVTLIGDNVTLVLCQVVVHTVEFSGDVHGVLREGWYEVNYRSNKAPTMRENPAFNSPAKSRIILRDFDAPVDIADTYIQRLTSYLQVPESGNYTFYVSCDDVCELWKHDINENGIDEDEKQIEESVTKQPIITVKKWTGYLQWNRYPEQMSQPIFLDKCRIYRMVVFMGEGVGGDHLSVGMRKPSGEYERPIPGKRLFWTKPGTRRLEVTLQHHKTLLSAFVGSELRISGFYRFCCEGVYCPDCPLELNISTLGQTVSVDSALNLSCVNTSFTATFNTDRQPGNFTVKASYSFVNDSEKIVNERVLGHVHLQAAVLKECDFESGYCGWTSFGEKDKWKLSTEKTFVTYPGYFAYIVDPYKAQLESPLLPWKPFHQSVGLCLRFNYLMPAQSKSVLKVSLREPKLEKPVLVWRLVGYHDKEWSAAEVVWPGAKGVQIIFEGEGFLDNKINVAIDDVIVTTENCSLRPYFAKPGFSCSYNQFKCNNGECVKKNLLCDGDFACKDGSDEDNCECSSSKFTCQGGKPQCIQSTSVCDGKNDCFNGDDEKNCRNPCPSDHQCLDGSCVPWSKTCSQTAFCRDGTNTPSVCGSGKCHLNDLTCTSKKSSVHKRCRSFRGHCSFQNGQCGLKSDRNATFHWIVRSGQTLTEDTGPSYDHTSFDKDGSYIFIESSGKIPRDKARLLSGWIEPNEAICVQFWYHMHGSDIGNLNIYLKTNKSETLVWRLSGDQGNRWRFGQTSLNSQSLYRFVIEGTVGDGSKGDVAVDDLTVLDGICENIIKQASPDCEFEDDMCDWEAQEGWVLDKRVEGFETSGKFVVSLPAGASDVPSSLSSPVINTHTYEWKCLRFWYFIGSVKHGHDWHKTSLMVSLRKLTSHQTMLLLFADEVLNKAQYTQIPLPSNSTNTKIDFVGSNEFSGGPFLAIDDVAFSKEPCKQIPWKAVEECQEALGMENSAIYDRQISASSQLDTNHAAIQGRLHFKATPGKAGSWSAATNDSSQWLQVDLGIQHTKVTRVATQGRNAYAQWVTKYKLQYSNDGVSFQYYKENGQTADKDFPGNTDQDTVVYHELNQPIRARYIRFRPEAWHNYISMRVELYGCHEDCQKALGMENYAISNGQIRASSQWDANHAAFQGRLYFQVTGNKQGGWSALKSDSEQWLQVDLGSQYTRVTRVATQGRNGANAQWVTKYKLQYSNDGVSFQYYREPGQATDKDFAGNTDEDSVVYNELNPPIRAQYIRLKPESWHNSISMRMELYGCQEECQEALGMKNGAISDRQISASSQLDAQHAPIQGRLDFEVITGKAGSWSASRNDPKQWLQVDLGTQYTNVTRIATQGRNAYDQWVKKYKLQFSNRDGVRFKYYREPGQTRYKDFTGNTDRDTVVYHKLNPPIRARYIRFRPIAWYGHISMRVELYGCLDDAVGDCQQALGMENGAIPNGQVTASSQWDDNHAAIQGRLQFKAITWKAGSWSARKNGPYESLQVDLGSQYTKVTRVATQGRNAYAQWVTMYKLKYSNDGVNFQNYRKPGKTTDRKFAGNKDQDTVVFHELNPPIRARYIRFRPKAWRGHISMRVELYGCQECQQALGMENGTISDGQISASSQLDANHTAIQGRLQRGTASWSSAGNDSTQWLRVDLGGQHTKVTRVATQGGNGANAQWVTKYKLQYSNDGASFQYYREPGQNTDKDFAGNGDQDTVVYHELNPPIRARYIRFRPVAWHNHISMRVELYGCQDDRPCDISVDWCGWKSVRGWKIMKYKELDQAYQQDGGDNNVDKDDADADADGDEGNYEIHLPDSSLGYVSFSDLSPRDMYSFTICFWLKTAHSGFFIEYKVATSEQNKTLVLGIYCGNDTFDVLLGNKRSYLPMSVTDDTWHHVCVLWDAVSGLLAVFKDGERNYRSNGFRLSSLNIRIEGEGTMTIGFRATSQTTSVALGKLSGFNIWSYAVKAEEILRMSHGCGTETGDAKAWETVRKGLEKEVEVHFFRTCNDRKGDRLVVDTNSTLVNQSAVLVSPPYNRSREFHSKCLRFRYMLRGPGEKTMTVYQKANSHREIPIWVSKINTGQNWIYGQVPLSSVSKFQVLIKGETEKKEDLIALTGLYIDEGKHCKHKPELAKQACSENLFNMSGYFFSPSFPGYYLDDIFCTWHITVPFRYTIRLEFHEFRLKDHPTCENCFLQIFDGRDTAAPAIGRFCGYVYPPVFVSSSNHFTIVLRCHGNLRESRFKAFYHSIGALDNTESSCSRQQGCPSSCKCEEFGGYHDKKILVTGEDLLTVPSNLPFNTGAVLFQQNRISQLREKDFADLTKLEYIDMSFNILLHLDEDCFQSVSSVNTLRLNSNFFRTLPAGAFTGLPNLRVLDLGRNLLRKAVSGMLDGLSNLEVLSLRANQLKEMEYGVFDDKSNITYLYLQNNKLTTLPDGLFGALSKLKLLNLSSNRLKTVTKETFQGLKSLEYLYLDGNRLSKVPPDAFSELTSLKYLKLDRFILCCYAKKSIEGVDCDSPVDEFSSCDDLMKNNTLQICIWILGILAFVGNLLVIIWRIIDKEENRIHSFLLTNLAVADMFMGVYLLTIAIMDVRWHGEYFKHDIEWRSGLGCQIIGALSMLSSEVSVLILTIITIDRFICIIFPFTFKRLTYKTAVLACIGAWIFGVVISVIPITGINYFYDESGNFGFYSRSAVCLPLQLSEGTPAGWEYSVAFFIGLNFISFMFILVAYISMFCTVKRVTRAARSTNLNKESAMAKRLVFIVMTDFCCWMPIIIINILSLTGNFDDPNKIAYVWIAVFVLPLNSSLNPILYTFSTERTKRNLNRKRKNVTGFVMKTVNSRGTGAQKLSVDWLKTNCDNTLVSSVCPDSCSPLTLPRAAVKQERESKQVHAKLRLIEEVNILQDDTAGKRTGYATSWCEEGGVLGMVLLKYFGKEMGEDWTREVDMVRGLACGEDPHANLPHYRWHSKACDQSIEHGKQRIRALHSNSLLICYDFVSSSTLEDFLCENGTVLNFDAVCAIACDVISAIERLQDVGILHNNITTSNILIGQCSRNPPITATLGGFSRASKMNEPGAYTNWAVAEQSNYGNDIEQFGQLLATLLGHCHGSSEYIKLHEIMNLCFEAIVEKKPEASHIRELLEGAWCTEGVWDTYL